MGNTQYQYSRVSSGNMCCGRVGYWNSSGICCSYRDVKYGDQVGVGSGGELTRGPTCTNIGKRF